MRGIAANQPRFNSVQRIHCSLPGFASFRAADTGRRNMLPYLVFSSQQALRPSHEERTLNWVLILFFLVSIPRRSTGGSLLRNLFYICNDKAKGIRTHTSGSSPNGLFYL